MKKLIPLIVLAAILAIVTPAWAGPTPQESPIEVEVPEGLENCPLWCIECYEAGKPTCNAWCVGTLNLDVDCEHVTGCVPTPTPVPTPDRVELDLVPYPDAYPWQIVPCLNPGIEAAGGLCVGPEAVVWYP